jgi:hypothetical protein
MLIDFLMNHHMMRLEIATIPTYIKEMLKGQT